LKRSPQEEEEEEEEEEATTTTTTTIRTTTRQIAIRDQFLIEKMTESGPVTENRI